MGAPNLTLRMLAMWQIVERIGAPGIEPLKAVCKTGNPNQKVCALWALFNLKALSDVELSGAVVDGDFLVRTHAMRILSEMTTWNDAQRGWAVNGVSDANAWVQRAAADALGRHAAAENVKALIALKANADGADTHLVYTVRMALRNQLMLKGISEKLVAMKLDASALQALADSAAAAQSEDAAAVLVRHLASANEPPAIAAKYFEHAMKYLPFNELDALVASARARFGADAVQQVALLKAIQDGASQRGIALSPTVRAWAVETISTILVPNTDTRETVWTALALDGTTPNAAYRYQCPSWSWKRNGSSAPPTPLSPHVNGPGSATNGPVGELDVARPMH